MTRRAVLRDSKREVDVSRRRRGALPRRLAFVADANDARLELRELGARVALITHERVNRLLVERVRRSPISRSTTVCFAARPDRREDGSQCDVRSVWGSFYAALAESLPKTIQGSFGIRLLCLHCGVRSAIEHAAKLVFELFINEAKDLPAPADLRYANS